MQGRDHTPSHPWVVKIKEALKGEGELKHKLTLTLARDGCLCKGKKICASVIERGDFETLS